MDQKHFEQHGWRINLHDDPYFQRHPALVVRKMGP